MAPRLLEHYRTEIVEKLTTEFSYQNVNQVPKIEKVVINIKTFSDGHAPPDRVLAGV